MNDIFDAHSDRRKIVIPGLIKKYGEKYEKERNLRKETRLLANDCVRSKIVL